MPNYRIMEGACGENARVTNISGAVNTDNELSVTWTWPRQKGLDYVLVYEMDEDLPLKMIIERKITPVILDDSDKKYSTHLTQNRVIKIYGAAFIDGCYEIVNQTEGNCSEMFYRKVTLNWSVSYKKEFLSSKMTAFLEIRDIKNIDEDYLLYRCKNGSRGGILYPIDIRHFREGRYQIHLTKNEEIELELTEKQKKYITLRQNGKQ
ncbi:MAG: hypothetical protein K6E85_02015 [Lachnospiraceae bacterium]|nr:hypothetical protein [Lachnospiraceae bacterium]